MKPTPAPVLSDAGANAHSVNTAVDEFVNVLGSGAVATDSEDIAARVGVHAIPTDRLRYIAALIAPSSVAQVQAVVSIANRYRVPLWLYTGHRHHGQGASVPRVPGFVIVDLRRMNRVLEINEKCAYAVVEPGVSFFDLYEHLRAGGHELMMPVPDLACDSVVDYVLDGGHALQSCGMEMVLANGSLVRTGMGALSTSRAWHTCGQGLGLTLDGLLLQSDLGIVTRMGVWLKPRPERYLSCNIVCRHDRDLQSLVDMIRPFLMDGTISNHPVLSNLVGTAARIAGRQEWYPSTGVIPEETLERIADETGLGRWNLRFALYGRHDVVEAQLATLAAAFGGIAQAVFSYREYDGNAPEEAILAADKSQAGIPEPGADQIARWAGSTTGDYLTLSSVARLDATDVEAHYRLVRAGLEQHGFDHQCMFVLSSRSALQICCISFDRTVSAQVRAAHAAFDAVLAQAAEAGFGPHGPHTHPEDGAVAHFSFNDHALQRMQRSIKELIDPNGILASRTQWL
ncbi:FAD-binding protein [Massilia dura]|uniref:FAD-binding protein n=1 Tax=Pseudoduganella dura TaxID=321982 RepID=A0A6I3XB97_9BURK|nr:FAD-binding protein [Pseudoduganella dura]MUI11353.1 FAD-binding protein [Pseudoduganella dura]GGX95604.1 4-cresol dehydrogenase [Pseudoduganella dura]